MAKIKTLDVFLDSSGGDPDAAYQLITFLRTKCEKMRMIVPDWAKSAATLMCLGADEIWMTDTAELGPLDTQIQDPKNPQERLVSSLEQFRAMDYLKRYSFEMLDTYVNLLIQRAPTMRLKDMIGEATPFVTQLMAPLYGQVDPMHFGGSFRALDLAIEYGKRLLSRYVNIDATRINQIVDKLTWQYPSHGFVIDFEEAKSLGLNVFRLNNQQESLADTVLENTEAWVGFLEEKK